MLFLRLDDCVAFLTNKVAKELADELNRQLLTYGITRSQWIAMYFIDKNESINQKELADLVGAKESTIAGILNRLENEGLIKREISLEDKRKKFIRLTELGQEKHKIYSEVAENFKDKCVEDIEEEEIEIFVRVLGKMCSQFKTEDEEKDCFIACHKVS